MVLYRVKRHVFYRRLVLKSHWGLLVYHGSIQPFCHVFTEQQVNIYSTIICILPITSPRYLYLFIESGTNERMLKNPRVSGNPLPKRETPLVEDPMNS